MKAVVLAAGKGTRMMPLTEDRPKPMVEVAGRPFIDYVLDPLEEMGIQTGVVVSYRKEVIEAYLREEYPDVVTIDQGEPKGTGHAVDVCRDFVGDDNFLLLMGDSLYSPRDIRMVASFPSNVMAATHVEDPREYGVLELDGYRLKRVVEKPDDPPSNLINIALYKLTPQIFEALEDVTVSPRGEYEITDAITSLASEGDVFVYRVLDYWKDLGRPEDIEELEEFLGD